MRYLLFVGIAFALAGAADAWAFDTEAPSDRTPDYVLPYSDPDEAVDAFIDGSGTQLGYRLEVPKTRHRSNADVSVPWDAMQKRLVFGPFDRSEYGHSLTP